MKFAVTCLLAALTSALTYTPSSTLSASTIKEITDDVRANKMTSEQVAAMDKVKDLSSLDIL